MDAMFWTAVGAAACSVSAMGLIIGYMMRASYTQGKTHQRIATLEGAIEGHGEVRALIAGLTSTVSSLRESVDELKATMHEIAPRSVRRGA